MATPTDRKSSNLGKRFIASLEKTALNAPFDIYGLADMGGRVIRGASTSDQTVMESLQSPRDVLPGARVANRVAEKQRAQIDANLGTDDPWENPNATTAEKVVDVAGSIASPALYAGVAKKGLTTVGRMIRGASTRTAAAGGLVYGVQSGVNALVGPGAVAETPDDQIDMNELEDRAKEETTAETGSSLAEDIAIGGAAILAAGVGARSATVRKVLERAAKGAERIPEKVPDKPGLAAAKDPFAANVETDMTGSTKVYQQLADKNAGAGAALGKVVGDNARDEMKVINTIAANPVAADQQAAEALRSGLMPRIYGTLGKKPIKLEPGVMDAMRKIPTLAPEKADNIDKVLYAMDEIDTINAAKRVVSKEYNDVAAEMANDATPAWRKEELGKKMGELAPQVNQLLDDEGSLARFKGGWTKRELQQIVQEQMRDPETKAIVRGVQRFHQQILDYKVANGLVSGDMAKKMRAELPNYIPRRVRPEGKKLKDAWTTTTSADLDRSNMARVVEGVSQRALRFDMDEVEPTFRSHLGEIQNEMREAIYGSHVNAARRSWFASMGKEAGGFKMKGIREVADAKPESIPVLDGGKLRHYQVDDPYIRQGLQYAPNKVVPILDTARKIYQTGTTGFLNPLFAVRAATYDAVMAWQKASPELRTTFLNAGLREKGVLPDDGSGILNAITQYADLTAVPASIINGYVRALGGNATREISEHLYNKLAQQDSWLVNKLGENRVRAVADRMSDAYNDSTVRLGEQLGISSGRYSESSVTRAIDPQSGVRMGTTGIGRITPDPRKWKAALQSVQAKDFDYRQMGDQAGIPKRLYRMVIGSLHDATKIHVLSLNRGRFDAKELEKFMMGETVEDSLAKGLNKIGAQTREATVDLSKRGANKAMQYAASSSPYANIAVQSLAQTAAYFKKHPDRLATSIMFSAVMPALSLAHWNWSGSGQGDRYAKLSPAQRAANVIIMNPTNPEKPILIPKEPIFAAAWNIAEQAYLSMTGAASGRMPDEMKEMMDTAFETGKRVFDMSSPPPLAAAGSLAGLSLPTSTLGFPQSDLGQQVETYNPNRGGDPTKQTEYIGSNLSTDMTNFMNSMFGMAGNTAVDFYENVLQPFAKGEQTSIGRAIDDTGSIIVDRTVKPNTAWTGLVESKATISNPYTDYAFRMKQNMDKLESGVQQWKRGGNVSQKIDMPLEGAKPWSFRNEQEAQIAQRVVQSANSAKKQFFEGATSDQIGINVLRRQMESIKADHRIPLEERKGKIKKITEMMNAQYKGYADYMKGVEEELQGQLGPDFSIDEYVNNGGQLEGY